MAENTSLSAWQRWLRQPQKIWFRRALFQIHLWSGIGIGLYVLMISLTGSILVYSNELYFAATPKPIVSTSSHPRLSNEELTKAAESRYPGYTVENIVRSENPDEAVDIWLHRGGDQKERLFDPRTGADVGKSVPLGITLVSKLRDLHDNLLGGKTGRQVNGIGAMAVICLAATGIGIWWPGIAAWRRSLVVHRGVGWKRMVWELHSMLGFWTVGFTLLFAVTGIYLTMPGPFENLAERFDWLDTVIYWFSILHFGRVNGIGFVCGGQRGVCDQTVKAIWALFGLAPALMFVSGAIMWWNRVLHPRWAQARESHAPNHRGLVAKPN